MARVLIVEPYADVSELLQLLVSRLGHEAFTYDAAHTDVEDIGLVDLAIVEPADGVGYAAAKALRRRAVPLVFASVYPPEPLTLALEPAAYIVKPFTRRELDRAIDVALASGAAAPSSP